MELRSDTSPAHLSTAVNPAKLRDEIHRLSQRLVRAGESYNQDFLSGDPEVPLDEQLAIIESYRARLDVATEQLRQHEAGTVPPAPAPQQPTLPSAEPPYQPAMPWTQVAPPVAQAPVAQPQVPQPPIAQRPVAQPPVAQPPVGPAPVAQPPVAPAAPRARQTGPGIENPDGTPLLGDGGTVLRTEDAAVGEYVRHAADQRWLTASGRSFGGEFDAICEGILVAIAHKHGVALEDVRQQLSRQVDARYRRDYG
ncbi:hypothetical protein [Cellulomonas sp. URHD0024]|uniref:hypothetical protein n=1 Tax=Cellulomonas sp. URHD0024 TaxID=1302620 RepID=UPI000401E516|nr:hypothetical protein [Cellulomonas sp. URHD0024]